MHDIYIIVFSSSDLAGVYYNSVVYGLGWFLILVATRRTL